ncbi:hypothetical protein BDP27DRAFT_1371840 [Rhodocollybia butyracea]|uniref:Uncharacterized protein n=1 Tax=Rhodocollybia butyracea TaxID=206335 RepID=A0A9P5P9P1_9AGAR|nr:hypothetical protein BDP27DRAFT_1371840 [Rhodocollybia butyracea]
MTILGAGARRREVFDDGIEISEVGCRRCRWRHRDHGGLKQKTNKCIHPGPRCHKQSPPTGSMRSLIFINLFIPESFWQDILAFTWDFRTSIGWENIQHLLKARFPFPTHTVEPIDKTLQTHRGGYLHLW